MTRDAIPTSFSEAKNFLNGKWSRKVANNTYVESISTMGRTIALRLHSTYIVEFHADGRIILDTGRWQTVTTKDRLNRVLRTNGYSIFAKDHVWYLWDRWEDRTYDYKDGMILMDGTSNWGNRVMNADPATTVESARIEMQEALAKN